MTIERGTESLVMLGVISVKVDGCDKDSMKESTVQLTPEEIRNWQAKRPCGPNNLGANLQIYVFGNGCCSATCITGTCEFNSANRRRL
jgi:hypothetical protein